MPQEYQYKGQTYSLKDGLSDDQALGIIKKYLSEQKTTQTEVKKEEIDYKPKYDLPEEVQETTAGDIAQGIGSGLIRGIIIEPTKTVADVAGYFGAEGTDEFRNRLERAYNMFQKDVGLEVDSEGGRIAERLSGFLGAFVGLGKFAKFLPKGLKQQPLALGQKAGVGRRVSQAVRTSVRGGAAEFLSAPDGSPTLADSFDALPDELKTDNEVKIMPREDIKRRLGNKLKLGAEATAFGLGIEAAFPIVGKTVQAVGQVPGVGPVMKSIKDGFAFLGSGANKLLGKFPQRFFASKGLTPTEVFEGVADTTAITKAEADKIAGNLANFEKELKKVIGGQGLFGRGRLGVQEAHDNLYDFISGVRPDALDQYGEAVVSAATKMRSHIDELSEMYIGDIQKKISTGEIDGTFGRDLINTITEQQGKYIRREYEGVFAKGDRLDQIRAKPEYREAVRKLAARFPNEEDSLGKATQIIEDIINENAVGVGVTAEETLKKQAAAFRIFPKKLGERPLYETIDDLFKARDKFVLGIPEIRALKNEIKDPFKVYARTVTQMAESLNANRLYSSLSDQLKINADEAVSRLNQGGRPLIISGENLTDPKTIQFLENNGYVKLGEYTPQRPSTAELGRPGASELTEEMADKLSLFGGRYGRLSGDYVAPEIYNSLTSPVRSGSIANYLLGHSLQMKGLAQLSKTVLNPLSQIRNFNSGVFFIMANGNIARNMNLGETMHLAYKHYGNMTTEEQKKFFETTARLGIRDENLVVNEIQEFMKKAGSKDHMGVLDVVDKIPGVKPLQDIYMGTDTYWKLVGFLGEKAKYSAAFRKAGIQNIDDISEELIQGGIIQRSKNELIKDIESLDVLAGDIVKETMPIYSRVPQSVKFMRKVPFFGAFASFPAEIIRNSGNILGRGLDEMGFVASESLKRKIGDQAAKELQKQIRGIGAQRVAGYVSSAYVMPKATVMAAQKLTGISDEELQKLKTNFLPDYMLGHQIMPLNQVKKDGRGDYKFEYADLSYMMPYDFVLQPARMALDVYNQKGFVNAADSGDIANAALQSFFTFMEPFGGESLVGERLFDALFRGRTRSGIRVYNENDTFGVKFQKGVAHVLNSFNPAILEQTIFKPELRGAGADFRVELGRIGKAVKQSVTGEAVPGGKGGVTYDVASEALTAFTGVRPLVQNINTSLYYKGREYEKGRNNIKASLNNIVRDTTSSKDDIINEYKSANEVFYSMQQKLYASVKAARDLGVDDETIYKKLIQDSGLSKTEFDFISDGKFIPYELSKKTIQDFYESRFVRNEPAEAKEIPYEEIEKIKNEFSFRSLESPSISDAEKLQPKEEFDTRVFDRKPQLYKELPEIKQNKPLQKNQVFDILNKVTTAMPELLGSNPIDAAKNMQILQRRNQ